MLIEIYFSFIISKIKYNYFKITKIPCISNFGESLNRVSLFKNKSEFGLYLRSNTMSNSIQVFKFLSLHIHNQLLQFVILVCPISLSKCEYWLNSYRASTKLRYQRFENCLSDETWVLPRFAEVCQYILYVHYRQECLPLLQTKWKWLWSVLGSRISDKETTLFLVVSKRNDQKRCSFIVLSAQTTRHDTITSWMWG